MGSKAQAKASGAWAAAAKKNGHPVRNTVRCPVCYSSVGMRNFPNHTNTCRGPRRKSIDAKPSKATRVPSLARVVEIGFSMTDALTFEVARRIDVDAQMSKPSHWLNDQ